MLCVAIERHISGVWCCVLQKLVPLYPPGDVRLVSAVSVSNQRFIIDSVTRRVDTLYPCPIGTIGIAYSGCPAVRNPSYSFLYSAFMSKIIRSGEFFVRVIVT